MSMCLLMGTTANMPFGCPNRVISSRGGARFTVVCASKDAGITIFVSHWLENVEINYLIITIWDPATVEELKRNGVCLFWKCALYL